MRRAAYDHISRSQCASSLIRDGLTRAADSS
jgi:hypothetical protein